MTMDYYQVLGVERTATRSEIKKAFHRLVVQVHPDKSDDAEANENFVKLRRCYETLIDDERRKVYDETGEDDEDEMGDPETAEQLYNYYRKLYPKVTTQDIESFEAKYRGSAEEVEDVLDAYDRTEGDMVAFFDWIPCSELVEEDVERFASIIDNAIRSGDASDDWQSKFRKSTEKARKKAKGMSHAKLKKKRASKKSGGGMEDLQMAILGRRDERQNDFSSMLDGLANKYGGAKSAKSKKATKSKKSAAKAGCDDSDDEMLVSAITAKQSKGKKASAFPDDPLDDEEFAKIQARLGRKKVQGPKC